MKQLLRTTLVSFLLGATIALAQDGGPLDHPLFGLLATMPAPTTADELESLRFLDYLDMRATEQALRAITPESWALFEALDDDRRALWFAGAQRWAPISTGYLNGFTSFGEETREAVGFDPFEVDRLAAFGQPPATSLLLEGRFDPEAIAASLEARDYAAADLPELQSLLLRRADGEDDMTLDLRSRNPANPLGGQLGRKEPLAVLSDTLLANAPIWEQAVALAEAFESRRPSLFEDDDYRAAAEALVLSEAAPELLIQAQFLSPSEFAGALGELLTTNLGDRSPEEVKQLADEQLVAPLEPYALAMLGDGHDGDEQVVLMALVYPTAEQTEAARPVLEARLAIFSGNLLNDDAGPFLDSVRDRLEEAVIYDAGTRAVLVVGARYPAVEIPDDGGRPAASGALYRQWIQMILRRTFFPAFH